MTARSSVILSEPVRKVRSATSKAALPRSDTGGMWLEILIVPSDFSGPSIAPASQSTGRSAVVAGIRDDVKRLQRSRDAHALRHR